METGEDPDMVQHYVSQDMERLLMIMGIDAYFKNLQSYFQESLRRDRAGDSPFCVLHPQPRPQSLICTVLCYSKITTITTLNIQRPSIQHVRNHLIRTRTLPASTTLVISLS
jgi:hypothetical protein